MGRSAFTCLLAAALALSGTAALAKDEAALPGAALLGLAEAKAKAGELVEAGGLLAQGVAAAVKAKSLAGEQRAVEVLEELLESIEQDARRDAPSRGAGAGRWKVRELMAAVHAGLDAKRRGLYVSAPALAFAILLDAIAIGDATHLAPAAATLRVAGAAPKAGVAAGLFARLADGVVAAREGKTDAALAALSAAGTELEGRGFVGPALHARLEQAAVLLGAGREPEAFDVLAKAVEALPAEPDPAQVRGWLQLVAERLEKASPAALDAFRERSKALRGAVSAGAAGGRGGRGGSGGDLSPVGKALERWSAGKAFVTATRRADGMACTLTFEDGGAGTVEIKPGQTSWDAGGVTLLVAGPAVALHMVDVTGRMGQPGERSHPSPARAWVWLAVGETYAASPSGVEVTGKAAALTARTGR